MEKDKEEIKKTKIYTLMNQKELEIKKNSNSLFAVESSSNKAPKDKSYIKVTGCRVNEFKIIRSKN